MFSRMTADRFEKEKEECPIGPGSYELPPTLDEHAARISGTERFNDVTVPDTGPDFCTHADKWYKENTDPHRDAKVLTRPTFQERRALADLQQGKQFAVMPGHEKANATCKTPRILDPEARELRLQNEQLKKQLTNEECLRASAESKAADLTAAKKWAAETQVQLQSKDRKIEDMQRKIEDLSANGREAQLKLRQLESDEGGRRKALHEKDQATTTLNKGLEQQKVLNAKLKEQVEKGEAEEKQKAKCLEALTEELRASKANSTHCAQNLEELQREKEAAQREVEEQRARLKQAEQENKAEMDATAAQLEAEVAAREALEQELKAAVESKPAEESQRLQLEGTIQRLEAEQAAKEREAKDLTKQLSAASEGHAALEVKARADMEERERQIVALEVAAKAEQDRLKKEKTELENAAKAHSDQLAKEKAELEAAAKAEKERLMKEKAERETATTAEQERLVKEKADLEVEREKLRTDLDSAKGGADETTKTLQAEKEARAKIQLELDAANKTNTAQGAALEEQTAKAAAALARELAASEVHAKEAALHVKEAEVYAKEAANATAALAAATQAAEAAKEAEAAAKEAEAAAQVEKAALAAEAENLQKLLDDCDEVVLEAVRNAPKAHAAPQAATATTQPVAASPGEAFRTPGKRTRMQLTGTPHTGSSNDTPATAPRVI